MQPDTLNTLLQPIWLSPGLAGRVEQEAVLFVQEGDGLPDAPLLFTPTRILAVRSAALDCEYVEGRDWVYQNGRLALPPGSRIFYFRRDELRPQSAPPGAGMFPGRDGKAGVLFAEGDYFHRRQAAVTYEYAGSPWQGPVPAFQGSLLPRALHSLQQERRLNLVLFGDSISVGANASGFTGAPPYLPPWGELVRLKLADHYQAEIVYANPSEGGRDTAWGLAEIEGRVAALRPDLVILAFGMNDGTGGLEPALFRNNLSTMMAVVRRRSPQAEFILVAPMLANPESLFDGRQPEYGEVVQSLRGAGVATVDMGSLHAALLKRKRYVDLTGNHINHPNDFLSRCYAAATLSTLMSVEGSISNCV